MIYTHDAGGDIEELLIFSGPNINHFKVKKESTVTLIIGTT